MLILSMTLMWQDIFPPLGNDVTFSRKYCAWLIKLKTTVVVCSQCSCPHIFGEAIKAINACNKWPSINTVCFTLLMCTVALLSWSPPILDETIAFITYQCYHISTLPPSTSTQAPLVNMNLYFTRLNLKVSSKHYRPIKPAQWDVH